MEHISEVLNTLIADLRNNRDNEISMASEIADVDASNRETEAKELAWLKTHPDRCTLYARVDPESVTPCGFIETWLGTRVSTAYFGPRAYIGFDKWTYRRSIHCVIFGVRYHGWFMESSGDYCRLRKSKATKGTR